MISDDTNDTTAQAEGCMQGGNTTPLYDSPKALPIEPGEFYSRSWITDPIERRGADLWAARGDGAAALAQTKSLFVDIAKRTQLPEGLVVRLAEAHIDGELGDVRVVDDPDAAVIAEERRVAEWTAESRAALRETYGKDGEQMLQRVQKFVRSHPPLAKVLRARGLGSRPDVVRDIAAFVFSTGYR